MELKVINEMIDELEESETSLSNVRNLAALYDVRANILGTKIYDNTVKELNDILPSYTFYVDQKRKYQLKEADETGMLKALSSLCKEIEEFLLKLFSSTDSYKEREKLAEMLKSVWSVYIK